jgi:hypothetical protein
MTHTLHRQGKRDSLSRDIVVFAIAAQGVNAEGTAPAFTRFAEIVSKFAPVNIGDMRTGNVFSTDLAVIRNGTKDNSIFHAVFTDAATVAAVLAELKRADLGLSIVLSGLFDTLAGCCREAGVERHTIEHSLGVWGRTDLLPSPRVLQVSTMCGHGMVGFPLIQDLVERIKGGALTVRRAAEILAARCHCGVFNPVRGRELLTEMVSNP